MKRRRIPVITKKILSLVFVSGFLLCTLVFFAGYWAFSRQFRKQYDSSIRAVATAARECLNPDQFPAYIAAHEKDEAYDSIHKILVTCKE